MELLGDFRTTVRRALDEIDPKWRTYPGLVVCGTHSPGNIIPQLEAIKKARVEKEPFLGICFGMQLALIEFCRNVFGCKDANTEEINPNVPRRVIVKMPDLRVGMYPVTNEDGEVSMESHWHNYSFNKGYHREFSDYFDISYTNDIAEIVKLRGDQFFMGVQFHPEYQSSKSKPHPILVQFINICKQYGK